VSKKIVRKVQKPPVAGRLETSKIHSPWLKYVLLGVILIITYIAYSPVLNNNFTNWDEKSYVIDNPHLHQPVWDGVKYFFGMNFFVANYHPLTMIVYMMEYHIAKLNPEFYHIVNLLIHFLNVILVFVFIYLLSGKKTEVAVVVAVFFAIHPMHVESVAWIAELKDVLYTSFFLGGLITYYFYLEGRRRSMYYFITMFLFILSLLSKTSAVIFPLILILLDYYIKKKINGRALLEKIPFIIVSIVFGIINLKAQETSITRVESHSIFQGFFLASYTMINYIIKLLIPTNLSSYNPLPDMDAPSLPMVYYLAPIAALATIIIVYKTIKWTRIVIFGFLFYILNIALVLQFIPVGGAIVADRYSYIPYIGLLFIIGMGFSWIYRSKNKISSYKPIVIIALLILSITASFLTNARCKVWENSDTLWSDVINKYPDCWQAYLGRAEYFMNTMKYKIPTHDDDIDKAFNDLNTAISFNKGSDAHAFLDRGLIYAMKGKPDSAIADYSKVLALGYNEYNIYMALGTTYSGIHQYDSAFKYFDIVGKLHGDDAQLLQNRGFTYLMVGKYKQSVEDYTRLILESGNDATFYYFRGCDYYKLDAYSKAINDFSKAIEIKPDYGMAYYNRSLVFNAQSNKKDALSDALKAQSLGLNIDPNYIKELEPGGTIEEKPAK